MEVNEKNYPTRRRPWTAVFLSLLMPGMGQIYCGSIAQGLVLMLIVILFSTLWMFGMMVDRIREGTPMAFFVVMSGFVLAATVVAAIDAYRRARRTRYDYVLKDYNKWDVYLVLFFICGAGTIGFTAMIKMNLFEAFQIPVQSMAPTIVAGQRVLADKTAYHHYNPEYGDVVLFKNPNDRKVNFIKRVVALGGDTVEVKDGRLMINGKKLEIEKVEKLTLVMDKQEVEGSVFREMHGDVSYQIFLSENPEIETQNFGPVTVPDYHCFVMGDNRNHSQDSRNFGCLSVGALRGKFTQVYWPFGHWRTLVPAEKNR